MSKPPCPQSSPGMTRSIAHLIWRLNRIGPALYFKFVLFCRITHTKAGGLLTTNYRRTPFKAIERIISAEKRVIVLRSDL